MRRAKQVEIMVQEANEYLKRNHVADNRDPVFHIVQDMLLKARVYEGFNFYTADGKLSGGKNTDHIQLY